MYVISLCVLTLLNLISFKLFYKLLGHEVCRNEIMKGGQSVHQGKFRQLFETQSHLVLAF